MNGKENRRIALTKRLIQDGLLRLLEEKSLDKISVTELCREADVNRATFYKYYGDPDDVLTTIKEQFFQELLDSQQQESKKGYFEAFEKVCFYLYEHKPLAKHIFSNLEFDISPVLTKLSHGRNGMLEYLRKNFEGDDIRLANDFLGYGCYTIVREWLLEDMDRTPQEIRAIVQKLINSGLFHENG